jgi:type IX secretion system PorP/SprF family membrane protein
MKYWSGLFIFFALRFSTLSGQDIHFSQYLETPSLFNPALVGSSSNYRMGAIYKDQWRSVTVPYTTFGGMFEMKIKLNAWEKVGNNLTEIYKIAFRKLAAGLAFYNDRAGDGNMGTTRGDLTLTSMVPLDKVNSLAIGLQGGIVQHSIDYTKLVWPDQYNGGGYDPTLDPGENFNANNFIHFDMAAGFLWRLNIEERGIRSNDHFKANAGVGIFHITKPKERFLSNGGEQMYRKLVVHGMANIGLQHTTLSIVPHYLLEFQGPSKELMVGCMVKHHLRDDSKFTGYIRGGYTGIGIGYRNKDAVIVSTLLEFGQIAIGMSYDVNISGLHRVSTYRGGFEIMLRFVGVNPFIYQNSSSF